MSQAQAAAYGAKELGSKFTDLINHCSVSLPAGEHKQAVLTKLIALRDKAVKALTE